MILLRWASDCCSAVCCTSSLQVLDMTHKTFLTATVALARVALTLTRPFEHRLIREAVGAPCRLMAGRRIGQGITDSLPMGGGGQLATQDRSPFFFASCTRGG